MRLTFEKGSFQFAKLLFLSIPLLIGIIIVAISVLRNRPPLKKTHLTYLEMPVDSFDPIHAASTSAQIIINNSFDGLVRWHPSRGVEPQIAVEWHSSPDGRTVEFRLNPNAIFQDGSRVTVSDVVESLNHLISRPSYFRDHYRQISSIKSKSDFALEIQLRSKTPHLLHLLAGVPAKIVKRPNGKIIGSGPFIPQKTSNEISLERTLRYQGDIPKTERIVFTILPQQLALERVERGLLDEVAFIPLEGNEISRKDGRWLKQSIWTTWIVGFDQRVSPFQRLEVRQEIARHLKSADFVRHIYPSQTVAFGILPPGVPGYLDGTPPQILAGSQRPMPKSVEIWIPDTLQRREEISEWIRTASVHSQVQLIPKISPFAKMIEHYAQGKYGAYILSINAEYPDSGFALRALRSNSSSNYLGIREPALDDLIDKMETYETPEALAGNMRAINLWLANQSASINLMHVEHRSWVRNCVAGIELSPISEGYINLRNVENRCSP